jgi:hypothetical protein
MAHGERRFLRDNAFLFAAIALPLLVVGFFALATVLPRWLVPPPAHDLLIRASGPYDQGRPRVTVEFKVRDGRVEAVVRPAPAMTYPQPPELFLFDHETLNVRKLPLDLPELHENDPPATLVVDALAGRRVVADTRAPDGYVVETRTRSGTGIVGELFGMNRYDSGLAVANRGRVVRVPMPNPYDSYYSATAVGWVLDEGR